MPRTRLMILRHRLAPPAGNASITRTRAHAAAAAWLRDAAHAALDAVLPRGCMACGGRLGHAEAGLCIACLADLPGGTAVRCPVCAMPLGPDGDPCADCRRSPPAFDLSFAVADYAPPVDHLITALKFGGHLSWGRALGQVMANRLSPPLRAVLADVDARERPGSHGPSRIGRSPVIGAVPLGAERLRTRGFNQSRLIARAFCLAGGWPAPAAILRRRRDTPAQAGLALEHRRANLRDTFEAPASLAGATVCLVDDVMTSGATLHACALALKAAGATRVINLVFARTR